MGTIEKMRILRRVLGIVGCISILLGGCSGRTSQSDQTPSQPAASQSQPEVQPPNVTAKEPKVPMVGKNDALKKPSPHPPSIEGKSISLDPLFGVPTKRIYPMDFELGALTPVDPAVQDAVRVVEEFFERMQTGRALKELLHPEYRWFLEGDLEQWEGKPISFGDIRFGTVKDSPSGVVEIPFRIMKEGKSLTGSILVEKKETEWYVADFTLDWNELSSMGTRQSAQKGATEKERFDPFAETRQ